MCTAVMDISKSRTSGKGSKKAKKQPAKYKKAPGAPRRFKSAFIFFSTEKHKEIRSQLGEKGSKEKTTNVAKMVSEAWKSLPADEREYWDDMARRDKERYEVEKSLYDGPWKVPAQKASKDPNAPKRPMSAFLSYSNSKRSSVKRQNPGLTNAEVSRVLASMWKNAKVEEKQVYIDEEFKLRQKYKLDISEWRANEEKEKEVQRKHREDMALRTLEVHKRQLDAGPEHEGQLNSREGLPQLQLPPHMTSYGDSRMERDGRAAYGHHHREESLEQSPMSGMDLLNNPQMHSSLNSPYGAYSTSFQDPSTMSSLLGQSAFNTAATLFDQQALMSAHQQHQQQWAARESALTPRGVGSRNDVLLDALRQNMGGSSRYASGRYPPSNRDYGGDEHQQGRGGDFNHFFDPSQGY